MSVAYSVLGFFGGLFGRSEKAKATPSKPSAPNRSINALYDAAQTKHTLSTHWSLADGLSADAANSPAVRKILRERSRLEAANNPHACGIIRTLGNDVVGKGPRVRCLIKDQTEVNRQIERDFAEWCKEVRFAKRLRVMRQTRAKDGEVYALLTNNPNLPHIVKLDFRPVECDQFTNPFWTGLEGDEVDGIRFDAYGNPVEYCMLKRHPGATSMRSSMECVWLPAESVIHLFLMERPGQSKGVPEMTSSLTIFAMVRGFASATLLAARRAASHTGILKTQTSPDEFQQGEPFESMVLPEDSLTTLPAGYDLSQMKAEHPITGFGEFTTGMLTQAARPVSMSRNIATGDSSGYNFSSSRLDRSIYYKAIAIDQADMEVECVDRTFNAFWLEYRDVADLPDDVRQLDKIPHETHWDQPVDMDPANTASARETNLRSGMTSYQSEFAADGQDYETEHRKQAEALGISYEEFQQKLLDALFLSDSTLMSTGDGSVDAVAPVQDAALNGAQIRDGLLTIVDKYVQGQIPLLAVLPIMRMSFPSASPDLLKQLIDSLTGFKPPLLADGSVNPATVASGTPVADGEQPPTPTGSAGVYTGLKRIDFKNNQKAIQDVLDAFVGGASEAVTRIALGRCGLTADEIKILIDDARDGKVDNPQLQEGGSDA